MDLWGPRRATSLKDARRRTGFVQIIRFIFVVGAAVSAGFLLGPVVRSAFTTVRPATMLPSMTVTILNPRFEGRDANGKPYVLTADSARRNRENASLVDLVNPRLEDETSTSVEAKEGVFDRTAQVLDLVGDVVMTDAAGYTFSTDRSRMFMKENRVVSDTGLTGFGPIGEVRADAYEVLDGGERIILTGNVWSKFVKTADRDARPVRPKQ
jgi:lipopolysaccharide export system protein LptC